jgi:AcrR family transcriptional regulator
MALQQQPLQPHPEPVDVRILQIAASHIKRFGIKRTTIVSIAAEAHMSHANVYRYFASKWALFEALGDRWLKPVEASLRQIADGPDPADDKLERLVVGLHRAYRDKIEVEPELFAIFVDSVENGRAGARRHRGRLQQEIQQVIEEGMASGVFFSGDQRRAMSRVFDALHRFVHPAAVWHDREVPRAQMQTRLERVAGLVNRALVSGLK